MCGQHEQMDRNQIGLLHWKQGIEHVGDLVQLIFPVEMPQDDTE